MIELAELVAVCLEAGQKGSCIIRAIHESGNLQCVEKGTGRDSFTGRPMSDIQTEADRQSEEQIFSVIHSRFPNLHIIGEEESSGFPKSSSLETPVSVSDNNLLQLVKQNIPKSVSLAVADLCLFVDPLDGTGEFVSGRLHCVSVLIGVALKGKPLAGIIVRPFVTAQHPGEFIYGVVGIGAFLDHKKMVMSRDTPCSIVTSLKREHRVMEILFASLPCCEVVREGGAGWKSWLVAIGTVHAYVYPRGGTKLWDVLAGDAIIEALGGCTTDACGRSIQYISSNLSNRWGIMLSRDPQWHRRVLVPASHAALVAAANDPKHTHWPHGIAIPEAAL